MRRLASLLLLVVLAALVLAPTPRRAAGVEAGGDFVCPPCGCAGDTLSHAQPGSCAVCGMELVSRSQMRKVAILVFPGVEPLDFAGPAEVFGATRGAFDVYTVGKTAAAVKTSLGGFAVEPAFTIADCPPPHILVVPGGGVGPVLRDPELMDWVRRSAAEAEIVMSVCSGAFVLGKAGLLDGLRATAHPGDIEQLRKAVPRATVVTGRRFVDNGRVITAGGVSAGIDASLHVIERLLGAPRAAEVATYLQHQRRTR